MMKNVNFLCLVLIISVFFTSCCDPYAEKRPVDYEDAQWICEDPYIYFNVDATTEEYYYPKGEIKLNDLTYPCKFYFIHQTNQLHIVVYKSKDFWIGNELGELCGECDFSSDILVFHIDKKRDTVFDGKYDTMTFCRIDY